MLGKPSAHMFVPEALCLTDFVPQGCFHIVDVCDNLVRSCSLQVKSVKHMGPSQASTSAGWARHLSATCVEPERTHGLHARNTGTQAYSILLCSRLMCMTSGLEL